MIESKNNLYVFVGEQIDVYEFDTQKNDEVIVLDMGYVAKYRVLKSIYGKYNGGEIIEFNAYDHYGFPEFAKYKTVLLYVSEVDGKLYHQKYLYSEVYKTEKDRWALCGNPYELEDGYENREVSNINFNPSLAVDVSNLSLIYAKQEYPSPFFEISGNKALCKKGVFAYDLFELERDTVLKARGLF